MKAAKKAITSEKKLIRKEQQGIVADHHAKLRQLNKEVTDLKEARDVAEHKHNDIVDEHGYSSSLRPGVKPNSLNGSIMLSLWRWRRRKRRPSSASYCFRSLLVIFFCFSS